VDLAAVARLTQEEGMARLELLGGRADARERLCACGVPSQDDRRRHALRLRYSLHVSGIEFAGGQRTGPTGICIGVHTVQPDVERYGGGSLLGRRLPLARRFSGTRIV